ncbi:MAG: SprT family zinc-dependent metalloprotease [Candidatus Moraniibacteriota bacterium]
MNVTIRRHRQAKHLRIIVRGDGNVTLTLPLFVSVRRGRQFLESKEQWIREKIRDLAMRPDTILRRGSAREYRDSRETARRFVEERLSYFQKFYKVIWKQVSIRNQKTRWGSCSRASRLSFNYRLLSLPPHLADYVIVHEMCHLSELNHSPKFWALVACTFPDYRALRRDLRRW